MMTDFLILKLQGLMQSWGTHSYEGLRPSELFPTRSGLVGLLGACLGVDRRDHTGQTNLNRAFGFAVRRDIREDGKGRHQPVLKMDDYHTVLEARKDSHGQKMQTNTVETRREYLMDVTFTVVLWEREDACYTLDHLADAVKKPKFTPFLGRRSCPLSRPLYQCFVSDQTSVVQALAAVAPGQGPVMSEMAESNRMIQVRDQPMTNLPRHFANRKVYMLNATTSQEGDTCS